MVLQSVVLPQAVCREQELYLRSVGNVQLDADCIVMEGISSCSTNTYMNMFDGNLWSKYTNVSNVFLQVHYSGAGRLEHHCVSDGRDIVVANVVLESTDVGSVSVPVCMDRAEGVYYCVIKTKNALKVSAVEYVSRDDYRDIRLSVVICTYKRNGDVLRNVNCIKNSSFFDANSDYYGRLDIVIVDNASELVLEAGNNLHLVYNRNTGGAGGFAAGLQKVRQINNSNYVVLMDDDVYLIEETLYRLYSFLSNIKKEYGDSTVAGRMFDLDEAYVQYTACEVWNGGDIQHRGYGLDMRECRNIWSCNEEEGEYSGWWFACFSYGYVENNEPIPFFLHCDDVEYGLRHGGAPIIINGVQVWHEIHMNRFNPVIAYYDWRNSLFVNEIRGQKEEWKTIGEKFKKVISEYHRTEQYKYEYMIIIAMRDYLRGLKWLYAVDGEKYHSKLVKVKANRYYNAIMWRIVMRRIRKLTKGEKQ